MPTPNKLSNINSFVNFTELLDKHGYDSDGYEKAVEEAVDIAQRTITDPNKASREDMQAEVEGLILRIAFARLGPALAIRETLKGYFINESPDEVANVTKYLFKVLGKPKGQNFDF